MKKEAIDIWFDFSNPPHVNLFLPFINHFNEKKKIVCTARDFAETIKLLDKYGIKFLLLGKHAGKNRISKVYTLLLRNISLFSQVPDFKLCISSSFESQQIAWLKRKVSIMFDDNEIAPNWLYSKFATFVFVPAIIDKNLWKKQGIIEKKIFQYPGLKEDIYIADYSPDPNFLNEIPFTEFVTVRPENILASYVPDNVRSIVPGLIRALISRGINVLYLPRYEIDYTYVDKHDKIFIPKQPLNGLDVCYYSAAVLTGAGTFAREAALIGTPAVSFFAGKDLLSVDKHLIKEQKMYYSRSSSDILSFLSQTKKRPFNNMKSLNIKKFVIDKIESILVQYGN
jgi:hypothetical protein